MIIQPLESIIMELESDNWLEVGQAIRKLIPHGDDAVVALNPLFNLTFHESRPVASYSYAMIQRLGKHAVPFLRSRVNDECFRNRSMALELLYNPDGCHASSTRLIEQVLDERRDHLPDWGVDPDEIVALFEETLHDRSLEVRYTAACALEEFGRHLDKTIPVFIEVLENGNLHQQNWAALHLARIGPMADAATEALVVFEKSCQRASLAASNALERIRA
jgi:hypothetical protein